MTSPWIVDGALIAGCKSHECSEGVFFCHLLAKLDERQLSQLSASAG